MEMEALRRAQEMHRNNSHTQQRTAATTSSSAEQTKSKPVSDSVFDQKVRNPATPLPEASPTSGTPFGMLDIKGAENLFEDKEKLLILLLIMVLSNEGHSDPTLILALLYLII